MTLMPKKFSHVFQFTRFVHCIVVFHFNFGAQFAEQGDIKSEFDSEQEKVREEDKRRREAEGCRGAGVLGPPVRQQHVEGDDQDAGLGQEEKDLSH